MVLDPVWGALAFGEENPEQLELPVSWATFSDGAGGSPDISGDADWGKIILDTGEEARSLVYDITNTTDKYFRIYQNRYGEGQGVATAYIRGNDTEFDVDIDNSFNGTTSFIETADDVDLTFSTGSSDLPFSHSCWIYYNGVYSVIMSKGDEYHLKINVDDTITVTLLDDDNSGYISFSTVETVGLMTLTHLTFTYDGGESASGIKVYKNGVLCTESSADESSYSYMVNTSGGLRVGRGFSSYSTSYFTGVIRESILYDKELSQAEITQVYGGTPLGSNIVANHQLIDDTNDSGPNVLNGVNTDITLSVPPWEIYTGQIIRDWRWVQVREMK